MHHNEPRVVVDKQCKHLIKIKKKKAREWT